MTIENTLHTLVYLSTASQKFEEIELEKILSVSRENNSRLDISGVLIYGGGNFVQVLEGEKDKVHYLYDKIKDNEAHHGFITLLDRRIDKRLFAEWSMGYRSVSIDEFGKLEGYINTQENDLEMLEGPDAITKMLNAFIRNNT